MEKPLAHVFHEIVYIYYMNKIIYTYTIQINPARPISGNPIRENQFIFYMGIGVLFA